MKTTAKPQSGTLCGAKVGIYLQRCKYFGIFICSASDIARLTDEAYAQAISFSCSGQYALMMARN